MKKQTYTPIILAAMTIAILAIIIVFTWLIPSSRGTKPIAHAQPTPQPVANTEQVLAVVTALAGTPTRIPAPLTTETIDAQATLVQKWQPGLPGTPSPQLIPILETWEAEGNMVPPPQYFETQTAIVQGNQTAMILTATAWPTSVPPAETSFGLDDPEFIALATQVPINDEFINKIKTQIPEELITSGQIACGSLRFPGSPLSQYFYGANYWVLYGYNKIGDREIPEFNINEVPYGGIPIPEGNYIIPSDAVYWYCIVR